MADSSNSGSLVVPQFQDYGRPTGEVALMRIGVIYLGRRGPGGPFSLHLATHLSKRADVFCAISEQSDYIAQWNKSGISLIVAPTFPTKTAAMLSYFNAAPAKRLAQRILKNSPDVIIYPMVHPWTPRIQHALAPTPDVVVVHDPLPHPGLLHHMSSYWEIRSARQAKRAVVLGQTFVDVLEQRGVSRDRIDVISHGVFTHYANEGPKTNQVPTILFFGRITKYKGLEVLLTAFRRLAKNKSEARLVIVGEGNLRPYEGLLKTTPNTTVVNRWVDDSEVGAYFGNASMLVLPYTSASQSGVIAIAAALGTPVIATRVGAIPEQIEDRQTGLLADPGSADQLCQAMEHLLDNHELAHRLGRNLAERSNQNASWDTVAGRFIATCEKAIGT